MARRFSGAQLRAARRNAGLKPERLALLINRSVYSIHQYELGRVNPTAPVLGALADALSVPVDALFTEEAVNAA